MESATPVDYFELLTGGAENLTESQWKEIVNAVVYCVGAGDDPDAAFQALERLLFENCEEWTDKRARIIRGAQSDSSNLACHKVFSRFRDRSGGIFEVAVQRQLDRQEPARIYIKTGLLFGRASFCFHDS